MTESVVWSEVTVGLTEEDLIAVHDIPDPDPELLDPDDADIMGFCGKEGISDEYEDARG